MASTFFVTQTPANGPGNKPHYAVLPLLDGMTIEDVKKNFAEGFVKAIEAENLHEATKQAGCPACKEGLKIIREIGF